MLLKMICAVLWAFCAGLKLPSAIEDGGWNWLVFILDVVCAVLWVISAYFAAKG